MPNAMDALDQVESERLAALDSASARKARNPAACLPEHLGHLAWSRGLDYWANEWTTAQKRDVILRTPANLRIRGTRGAIENALSIYLSDLQILEWFEQVPEADRGTALANITMGSSLAQSAVNQEIVRRILGRESRKSLHWTLALDLIGASAVGDEAYARTTVLYQYSGVQTGA